MIEKRIQERLNERLAALHLEVENESWRHSVPKGSETHFKVVVVSDAFQGKALLARHRLVQEALKEEIAEIRALSLFTFTPEEWEMRKDEARKSPTCQGGSKA